MTCLSKTADSEMCAKEKVIDWWNASFEHGTLLIIDPGVYLDKSSKWILHVFTYILGNQYQACMTLKKYLKLFSSRNFQCSIRRILLDATSALPSWILSHKLVICRFKFPKFKPHAKSCKIKFIASHINTIHCVVDEIYNLFNIYVQTRVAGYSQWNTGYTETVMFKSWNCGTKDDNIYWDL